MSRIFISYKRVDKEKVFKIKDQIESALGEKCWIDIDGIESDAQFVKVIINAIDETEVFLFMYSAVHSQIEDFENDWTIRELNYAKEEKKKIVFVNIDNTSLSRWFKFMFPQKQQVNGMSLESIQNLCRDLSKWLSDKNLIEKRGIQGVKNKETETQCIVEEESDKFKLFRVGMVGFKMIRVEGGSFIMGDEDPFSINLDATPHTVTLSTYYIGESPVTQKLWKTIMGNNPSWFEGDDNPVESVSWDECQVFLDKLNEQTLGHFRLPTEAEWEFAACGGNFSKEYKYSGADDIENVAWYEENSFKKGPKDSNYGTHPVMTKKPNELSIYDMSGNVWEWCSDWHGKYSRETQKNPSGPANGLFRIIRGGSWLSDAKCCLTSNRICPIDTKSNDIGFRLVFCEQN